ncbi:MAG: hypothetical protein ACK49J_02965, partial [Verrucomicrobiota bacterium]
ESVVRLTTSKEDEFKDIEAPVLLGPGAEYTGPKLRVKLPLRKDLETRSNEPSVETIINPEPSATELVENVWGDHTKNTKPIAWGWFAILAIVMTTGILWSIYKIEKSEDQIRVINEQAKTLLSKDEEEERNAAHVIDQMEVTLRKFHNVTTINSLAALVRHPERVRPLMEDYYGEKPIPINRLRSISSMTPLTLNNRADFWLASVRQSDDITKNIILQINEAGEALIDWETYVCYQPMDWSDYVNHHPAGTTMDFRVHARPDNLFSHEFNNPSQWLCFQLNAQDSNEFLYGYVDASSDVARQILMETSRSNGEVASLILRLYIPENLQAKRAVIIKKIICDKWLFVDPPAADP